MATLYGATGGSTNSNLYTIDPVTGVWTSIGGIGFAVTGLAFDPGSGILYGSTSNNSTLHKRSLISVNISTGVGTFIGAFSIGSATMSDIAFKSDGTLYGLGSDSELYTINKSTGAATDVGDPGFSGSGLGFEIDAADNGYAFPIGPFTGDDFCYQINLTDASSAIIGFWQNGSDFDFEGDAIAAASFDDSGVMWLVMNNFGSSSGNALATVDNGGTVVAEIGTGLTQNDALAWSDSVKPNPWFTFPVYSEDFEATPITGANCSTPGALDSTDGSVDGTHALKLDPAVQDAWVNLDMIVPPITSFDARWFYTSFALYVPSWSDLWDGGNAWDPTILTLGTTPNGQFYAYVQPTSSSTGVIETRHGHDSVNVPDGAWVAIEIAYTRNGRSGAGGARIWVNGTDTGVLNEFSALNINGITLGDASWGGPPPTDANMTVYIDKFEWSFARIGPVDLTGASFGGVGSGTDVDSCTGTGITAHPVNDSYTTSMNHALNGSVLDNDVLPTTASVNTGPTNGTLTVFNSDGTFTYQPTPGFFGSDSFTYDGNGGTGTVSITITSPSDSGFYPHFDGQHGFVAV